MVEVICDTNFLIHLANKRIRNLETFDLDIGNMKLLIPTVVEYELMELKKNLKKKVEIEKTLSYIKNLEKISIPGKFADKEILEYLKHNRTFVGTMDRELKNLIKKTGSSVISFNNDYLVLES